MSDKNEKMEFYSGIPWVNVTANDARAHPKGQLNWILWLIVVYFLGVGLIKFWIVLSAGGGLGLALLNSIWPFLTGVGLAIRMPWAVIMAIVSTGLTAWALVRGLGNGSSLIILVEMLANVGILFYLLDGDRPNLIYRHRYRKYSVEKPPEDD